MSLTDWIFHKHWFRGIKQAPNMQKKKRIHCYITSFDLQTSQQFHTKLLSAINMNFIHYYQNWMEHVQENVAWNTTKQPSSDISVSQLRNHSRLNIKNESPKISLTIWKLWVLELLLFLTLSCFAWWSSLPVIIVCILKTKTLSF